MTNKETLDRLRWRAACALDATMAVDERGPRTLMARARLAAWLDGAAPPGSVNADVAWLERVARNAARASARAQRAA